MGAANSRKKREAPEDGEDLKKMKTEKVIDYIASNYITQASFKDLENLNKKEYCDKLVILTSKVIKHHLNDIELEFLDQRTKGGIEINKMNKKNVIYLAKKDFDKLDVTNSIKKKRMCIGIAKFYIRVAHIFAAISMAINPRFTYTDATGIEKSVSLMEKGNIPSYLKVKYSQNSLCSRRISALMTKQNNENGIIVKPSNCNMNKKTSSINNGINNPVGLDGSKNLSDEPGIPELELLYFDKYDFDTGKYYDMSAEAKNEYSRDLSTFYKTFTGQDIPLDKNKKPLIKKFSEIPLKDFHNQELCKDPKSPWLKSYKGSTSDKLFVEYANHLKKMTSKSQNLEKKLLQIISQLFAFWIDPRKKEKQLTINPKLNDEMLKQLTDKTRRLLIDLYITCEKDFQKGLEIFEAIIKKKMLTTAQRKISSFEDLSDDLMVDEKKNKNEKIEIPLEAKLQPPQQGSQAEFQPPQAGFQPPQAGFQPPQAGLQPPQEEPQQEPPVGFQPPQAGLQPPQEKPQTGFQPLQTDPQAGSEMDPQVQQQSGLESDNFGIFP